MTWFCRKIIAFNYLPKWRVLSRSHHFDRIYHRHSIAVNAEPPAFLCSGLAQ